ncbi:Hypothetical protein CINCED_3A001294 [Cinara cedri]|uniref:Mos1 transposase HTH domain-containing protein n=1 Tax=Cinara cedri TaxID=506608 RepID=A0A5E4M0B2_9HEMI|nr:Hypothetical protein CINCED_3A001294 [Cinara cedri]
MSSQQLKASNNSSSDRSTYRRCEIRSVIRFLALCNESAASIHRQLVETYGSEMMTRQHDTKEEDHGICLLGPERDIIGLFYVKKDHHNAAAYCDTQEVEKKNQRQKERYADS